MDLPGWREGLAAERRWREEIYRPEASPLSPEARTAFPGLHWWPPDPRFRVDAVPLARLPTPRAAALAATGEDALRLVEVGAFAFRLEGVACRLRVFEPAPGEADEPYLLVPFRDRTSGIETYGAGRYLDLDPRPDDVYALDFNRAYHPYCAFDDRWACTLPPPENALPLRVEAGERLPGRPRGDPE